MASWRFLLAHHHPDEYDRCYSLRGLRICARCAGLYPALVLVFALHAAGVIRDVRAEWMLLYLAPLPALVSWARRRLAGTPGSNPVSTVTGALLGLALGRGLALHVRDPWNARFVALIVGLAVWVGAVEVAARLRAHRTSK